jgi:tetratricopeptide (TPR) repeat protein
MEIFKIFDLNSNDLPINLSDLKFISNDHIRFENGISTNANNKGAFRGIRIQTNDNKTFITTIYNMVANHPIWGNNIQMSPKQMKLESLSEFQIKLKGFGFDNYGGSFSDYGITIDINNESVDKITLHIFDRNVDITYLKQSQNTKQQNQEFDFEIFKNYNQKWGLIPMMEKMKIATKTDQLNNIGANLYRQDNIDDAIEYFKQALEIMPINDDALINLARSYTKIGQYEKSIGILNKLYYLNPNTKNIIIGYSLLMHLLKDYDSDGSSMNPSVLIRFIKEKFNILTNDSEIKNVIEIINEPYNRDILVYMIGGGFGMGLGDSPYMTSDGTTRSVILDEIQDVLNWN